MRNLRILATTAVTGGASAGSPSADALVDKEAWAVYRQALRDITAQAGFPWEVEWPAKP